MIYIIVWSKADPETKEILVSYVQDYEKDQYVMASRQEFYTQESAEAHAAYLADTHTLIFHRHPTHRYLD